MLDHQGRSETACLQLIAAIIVRRIGDNFVSLPSNIVGVFKRFEPRSTKLEDSLLFLSLASLNRKEHLGPILWFCERAFESFWEGSRRAFDFHLFKPQ
jgi:hypothetical protein